MALNAGMLAWRAMRPDQFLAALRHQLNQAGVPCAGVWPTLEGDLRLAIRGGVLLTWRTKAGVEGVGPSLRGRPVVLPPSLAPAAARGLLERLDGALSRAEQGALALLDPRNRGVAEVPRSAQGILAITAPLLAVGQRLWGAWSLVSVLDEGVGRHRVSFDFSDGHGRVVCALLTDPDDPEARDAWLETPLGSVITVADERPRPDRGRRPIIDEPERLLAWALVSSTHPGMRWIEPDAGSLSGDGLGGSESATGPEAALSSLKDRIEAALPPDWRREVLVEPIPGGFRVSFIDSTERRHVLQAVDSTSAPRAFVRGRHFGYSYENSGAEGDWPIDTYRRVFERLMPFEVELARCARLALVRPPEDRPLSEGETPGLAGADASGQRAGDWGVAATVEEFATAHADGSKELNLALSANAPCDQACVFCGVDMAVRRKVVDDTDALVRAFENDIRAAAARGATTLRVNGVDPLRAPYLLRLLDCARDAGFEKFDIFSPMRAFADREFARAFVATVPARYELQFPIYGATAASHDEIVGAPGAFDQIEAAVNNLASLMDDRGRIIFTTIILRQNAAELHAIADLARALLRRSRTRSDAIGEGPARATPVQLGAKLLLHLPHPSGTDAAASYARAALSMTESIAAVYQPGRPPAGLLRLGDVLLCVALAHARRTGHDLLRADQLAGRQRRLGGRIYLSQPILHTSGERAPILVNSIVPCPHRAECALAAVCPAEVYSEYESLFGLGELVPVKQSDLEALPDAAALIPAIRAVRDAEALQGLLPADRLHRRPPPDATR